VDPFLALLVFTPDRVVPLLQLANFAALLEQCFQALRPAQKQPSIRAGCDHHHRDASPAFGAVKQRL